MSTAKSLRALLETVNLKTQFPDQFQPSYISTVGYHCYAEIKLNKKLSAPETQADANCCLEAIVTSTRLAAAFAALEGGELLEAQGEILHLTFPTNGATQKEVLQRLMTFASAFMNATYEELNRICGDDWQGVAMAADYGQSVILTTHNRAVVSLGTVANRPAKKLAEGVSSGYIAIRAQETWVTEKIRGSIRENTTYAPELRHQTRQREIIQGISKANVHLLSGYDKAAAGFLKKKQAITVFGHVVRADLHGFSSRIEAAFSSADRENTITVLVAQFQKLLAKAEDVFTSFPNHDKTLLPWAGDCLNGIIYPGFSETFSTAQESLPPNFGAHWHPCFGQSEKWTVGIAGGDADETTSANNGRVLLATIDTEEREFLVAVGWGVGMSLRAQETKGARPNDTVIPVEDYRQLVDFFKEFFSAMDNQKFYRASALDKNKLQGAVTEAGKAHQPANICVPSAKHWLQVLPCYAITVRKT